MFLGIYFIYLMYDCKTVEKLVEKYKLKIDYSSMKRGCTQIAQLQ
jgi:hypothetical protein